MGAKLSKKKKGYCLGAGKDGESTETTEVDQKETETQMGQKDAAEPNGENPSTDQTPNNGASEEQEAHVEKNGTEVPSGETTKDDLNKDQTSECKPSAEQKKVEESNKEQDKPEDAKSSNISQQTETGSEKEVKNHPEEKQKPDHDKEKESLAKDKPTQEDKSAIEQESSEPKQSRKSVTEPSAPLPDQKEVTKPVPDPETKVKVEKMEKEQTQVPMAEHLSQQANEEKQVNSVKEPERLNEKVEQLETALVAPVLQEPVPVPVVQISEFEPAKKVVEPETTEISLTDTQPVTELVKSESDLSPEPVTESVESKVSEEPAVPVPEVESVESVSNSGLVPCPAHEQLCSTKQDVESLPEPLPSNEVPDSTAHTEGNVKNHETLGNADQGTELVETAATTESEPAKQPSAEKIPDQNSTVAENGPTEQAAEEIQENKVQDIVSPEQEVDKEMQNEVKEEESVSDKQPTDHASIVKDCKDTEEVSLDVSKNMNDPAASEDTTVHDVTQDNKSEDKSENHEIHVEVSHEPSAPLIVDKHGVGNGLPLKEEVKEHLENGCDTILHELNGQGEGQEIEVCNE